jgi:hypothetical protein
MMVVIAIPAAAHSVIKPVFTSRRAISSSTVPRIIAPVAPSGCPMAIEPPLTLTRSCEMSKWRMKRMTTEAKASLTSNKLMSLMDIPQRFKSFSVQLAGPVNMIAGSLPMQVNPRPRDQSGLPAECLVAHQNCRSAVDDTARVASRVDVPNGFDLRISIQCYGIESVAFTHVGECRLEPGKIGHGRRRPHVLVSIEHHLADDIFDRDDGPLESALAPRRHGSPLRFQCEGIDVFARISVLRRDEVRPDALGSVVGMPIHGRIRVTSAAVRPDRYTRHGLDSTGDDSVRLTGFDQGGRKIDGL